MVWMWFSTSTNFDLFADLQMILRTVPVRRNKLSGRGNTVSDQKNELSEDRNTVLVQRNGLFKCGNSIPFKKNGLSDSRNIIPVVTNGQSWHRNIIPSVPNGHPGRRNLIPSDQNSLPEGWKVIPFATNLRFCTKLMKYLEIGLFLRSGGHYISRTVLIYWDKYDVAKKENDDVVAADLAYGQVQTELSSLRVAADDLINDIMADLRHSLRKLDGPSQRRIMMTYGAKYKFLPGEPPEDPPAPKGGPGGTGGDEKMEPQAAGV